MVAQVIEGTITLVAVYLVLSNAYSFSTVVKTVGEVYSGAVRALQGR